MPDPATVLWIASGLGGALTLVAVWAWYHTHKRIDDAWREIDGKADNVELTRTRDAQQLIFEQIREHDGEDRNRHVELVSKISRLEGILDLVLQELRRPKT